MLAHRHERAGVGALWDVEKPGETARFDFTRRACTDYAVRRPVESRRPPRMIAADFPRIGRAVLAILVLRREHVEHNELEGFASGVSAVFLDAKRIS